MQDDLLYVKEMLNLVLFFIIIAQLVNSTAVYYIYTLFIVSESLIKVINCLFLFIPMYEMMTNFGSNCDGTFEIM